MKWNVCAQLTGRITASRYVSRFSRITRCKMVPVGRRGRYTDAFAIGVCVVVVAHAATPSQCPQAVGGGGVRSLQVNARRQTSIGMSADGNIRPEDPHGLTTVESLHDPACGDDTPTAWPNSGRQFCGIGLHLLAQPLKEQRGPIINLLADGSAYQRPPPPPRGRS